MGQTQQRGGGVSMSGDTRPEPKATIMDGPAMHRALTRIAHEVIENNRGAQSLAVVGILRRGANIASALADEIEKIEGVRPPVGKLDISFYRDDVSRHMSPVLHRTEIPFDVDGRDIILVDDVLFSGRTVRAALDALIDFGRPATIQLAVMVDRGHRELPIRADYVGKNVPSSHEEDVRMLVSDLDGTDAVEIWDVEEERRAKAEGLLGARTSADGVKGGEAR